MSAHTPGPWGYEKVGDGSGNFLVEDPFGTTCRVFGEADVAEANARLIAAAPEMLEAARQAVDLIECNCGSICEKTCTHSLLAAAIAKAGGREVTT